MTPPEPDHEPLDPQEAELARLLRALPAGEPPLALDRRILRQAQDALAAPRRRPLAWAGSFWGIGTAAAAVLTVSVGWHWLQGPGLPAPPMETAAPAAQAPAADTRLSVDIIQRPPRDLTPPPPPPEPPPPPRPRLQQPPAAPVAEQVMALPEAFHDEHVDIADAAVSVEAEPARADAGASAPTPAAEGLAAERMAAPAAAPPALAKASAPAAFTADDLRRAKADQHPNTALWLRRIERRIEQNDLAGARASLALLRERYPGVAVPAALLRRLQP